MDNYRNTNSLKPFFEPGSVAAVDACIRNRLEIAGLSPATIAKVKALYPDWWQVRSPVDVWTAVEAAALRQPIPR